MRKDNNITEVVVPVLTPTYQILEDLVRRMKNINFTGSTIKIVGGADVGQFISTLLEQKAFTDTMLEMHSMLKQLEENIKVENGSD